jgi:hypothetical protein
MNKPGISGISSAMHSNQYNNSAGFFLCGVTRGGGKQLVAVHEAGYCYWGDHYTSSGPSAGSCAHAWKANKGLRTYKTAINSDPDNNIFIPYFSNSNVHYEGKSTGYVNSNENYCTMEWYKLGVRTYYTEFNVLHGPLNIFGGKKCHSPQTLFAQPHCGTPPYSYYWYKSIDGFNFQLISNSISTVFQLPIPPNNQDMGTIFFKLKFKDSINDEVIYKKLIRYSCP